MIKKILMLRSALFLFCFLIINCGHQTPNKTTQLAFSVRQNNTGVGLEQILHLYGYKTDEQKRALAYFLEQASILKASQNLASRFPKRKTDEALLNDLLELVQLTQKHFTKRTAQQERWEVTPDAWMQTIDKTQAHQALQQLSLTEKITPHNITPDALCILGSSYKTMQKRLSYAHELIESGFTPKHLILLGGERKAVIGIDGSEGELRTIAQEFGMHNLENLTETHLLQRAYDESPISKELAMDIIDTPRGDLPRPTTETTLMELVSWLKVSPDITSITFVSNQPYVLYQDAIITQVIKSTKPELHFETIGGGMGNEPTIINLIGSLGSYLWARTPMVIQELGITITEPAQQEAFIALYKNNPTLLKQIEKLSSKISPEPVTQH